MRQVFVRKHRCDKRPWSLEGISEAAREVLVHEVDTPWIPGTLNKALLEKNGNGGNERRT
jgi:hypothetical protein